MPTTDLLMDHLQHDATNQAGMPCPACPHPTNVHDALARRFCSATEAGELTRGCLCSGESSGASYGKSTKRDISDRAGRP
ncbi:RGCVC family protein [Amycolatopsis sp. lyj-112]|uniref:RGCVC family protein n=1 Tax=Amycolatopsis sp. lyj-112 TaxID=2789288 RepID=UPI0039794734